jgi:uncharacterized membrane protein
MLIEHIIPFLFGLISGVVLILAVTALIHASKTNEEEFNHVTDDREHKLS